MKGQALDFITNVVSQKTNNTNDILDGDIIVFDTNVVKDKSSGNKSLSGKTLDFTITTIGKWSWEEKKAEVCMICKLPFKADQSIARCPMCHSLFHNDHIFEWLKVKGKCPVCLQALRPGGTEEITF